MLSSSPQDSKTSFSSGTNPGLRYLTSTSANCPPYSIVFELTNASGTPLTRSSRTIPSSLVRARMVAAAHQERTPRERIGRSRRRRGPCQIVWGLSGKPARVIKKPDLDGVKTDLECLCIPPSPSSSSTRPPLDFNASANIDFPILATPMIMPPLRPPSAEGHSPP